MTSTTMSGEIAEQPAAVQRTLDDLRRRGAELRALAGDRRHVRFLARGSSGNAAVYGRYLLETHAGCVAGMGAPSVATHYDAALDLSDTVVVSVSQSGGTEEIVQAQIWAAQHGARTVAITNDAASPLAAASDIALVTRAEPEQAVPATKSYTTQLAAMVVLADALGPTPGALVEIADAAPGQISRLITERAGIDEAAERLADTTETLVSGRGLVFGTALEAALKLEETCLRPVRGLSYADLRHGPIAVVDDEHTALLLSAPNGPMTLGMTDLVHDLRGRDVSATVGVGGDEAFAATVDVHVAGPDLPEVVAPLALVVPVQLVVEALAQRLGLNPDAPRGLSKFTQSEGHPGVRS